MDPVAFAAVCVVIAPIYALTALIIWACCKRGAPRCGPVAYLKPVAQRSREDIIRESVQLMSKDMPVRTDAMMIASCAETAAAHFVDRPVASAAFKLAAIVCRSCDGN